jgi:hypothetical protein
VTGVGAESIEERKLLSNTGAIIYPVATVLLLLICQLFLLTINSFNWDEFLHYSMVQQLRDRTLTQPFQTLLGRLLSWAPYVTADPMSQMTAARGLAWGIFLLGLTSVYGLARQYVARADAAWATAAYLSSVDVLQHGFAIRTDPIAMAVLMFALFLIASRSLNAVVVVAVGALIGFAGLLTVKAVFYAPCFAGIAWARWVQSNRELRVTVSMVAIVAVAALTFAALLFAHRAGLGAVPPSHDAKSFLSNALQWLTLRPFGQPGHIIYAIITAPVLAYAVLIAPSAWRRARLAQTHIVALCCLCVPLLTLLFYRNVFPYFFVFLLAPVTVAAAPAIAELRQRFGPGALALAICALPLVTLAAHEPQTRHRQQALNQYVQRLYPNPVQYLDDCGIVIGFPRVVDHFLSGVAITNYRARGIPVIARAIGDGNLAFVVDNNPTIARALAGRVTSSGLLRADVVALYGNFVRVQGNLWLAGKKIAPADSVFDIPAPGQYTAASMVNIDGSWRARGHTFSLTAGRHFAAGPRQHPVILWRGDKLPPAPVLPTAASKLFNDY